jgi:hypothetical protein
MLPLRAIDTRVLGMLVLFFALLSGPPGCDGSNSGGGSKSEGSCDGSDSAKGVRVVILGECGLTTTAAVACSEVVCSFRVTTPTGTSVDYSGTPRDSAMFLGLINGTLTPPRYEQGGVDRGRLLGGVERDGQIPGAGHRGRSGGAKIICRAEIPFSVTITDPD